MSTKPKFIKATKGDISLYDWNIPAFDGVGVAIQKAVEEIFEAVCEADASCRIRGNKKDPMTIEIGIPLGGDDIEMPSWEFSMGDVLSEHIAETVEYDWQEGGKAKLLRLKKRLLGIVSEIDTALEANKPKPDIVA